MFDELKDISVTLDKVLKQMEKSNELMEKLTNQLTILTLPPDMKVYRLGTISEPIKPMYLTDGTGRSVCKNV